MLRPKKFGLITLAQSMLTMLVVHVAFIAWMDKFNELLGMSILRMFH